PARLFLRGTAANHCPYRGIAAGADADAVCFVGRTGRPCRDAAATAAYPQSGRTDADRLHGGGQPSWVWRTRNFAAIARKRTPSNTPGQIKRKLKGLKSQKMRVPGRGQGGFVKWAKVAKRGPDMRTPSLFYNVT